MNLQLLAGIISELTDLINFRWSRLFIFLENTCMFIQNYD